MFWAIFRKQLAKSADFSISGEGMPCTGLISSPAPNLKHVAEPLPFYILYFGKIYACPREEDVKIKQGIDCIKLQYKIEP